MRRNRTRERDVSGGADESWRARNEEGVSRQGRGEEKRGRRDGPRRRGTLEEQGVREKEGGKGGDVVEGELAISTKFQLSRTSRFFFFPLSSHRPALSLL